VLFGAEITHVLGARQQTRAHVHQSQAEESP
jgi:hypothetical protein